MNRYCSKCGKKIDDENNVCNNCVKYIDEVGTVSQKQDNIPNQNTKEEYNGFKIASLVLGIVSIVLSLLFNFLIIPIALVGLILGIVYTAKSKKFCAGIVLNIFGIIIPIVIIILLVLVYNNINNSISDTWEDYGYDSEYSDSSTDYDEKVDIYIKEEEDNNDDEIGATFEGNLYYSSGDDSETFSGTYEVSYFKEIKLDDFVNLINNKDDFILVISQTGCGHCKSYKPKIEKVANDNEIVVYYIEYDLLSSNERTTLIGYLNLSGTPTTVFFKDGVEVPDSSINGDTDVTEIETAFRNNGYIE